MKSNLLSDFFKGTAAVFIVMAALFTVSCREISDREEAVEYGSIAINPKGRVLDISSIDSAEVTICGYGMEDKVFTAQISEGKGNLAVVENIPAGKNRIVKVKACKTVNNVLNDMEGVELYGLVDVKANEENPCTVNKASTAVSKIFYELVKIYGADVSEIEKDAFDSVIPEVSHPVFTDSAGIAKDYVNGELKSASDYQIQSGSVVFSVPDGLQASAYVNDPASEKLVELKSGTNEINGIPAGVWDFYITTEKNILFTKTVTVEAGSAFNLGNYEYSVPSPRTENSEGTEIETFENETGTILTVYLASRTMDGETPFDSRIFYTLDGTEPDERSLEYSDGIEISCDCILRAVAVSNGVKSEITTKTFTFTQPEEKNITVLVSKSLGFPLIHYWNCSNSAYKNTTWPGVNMTEKGDDYAFVFENTDSVNFLIANANEKKLCENNMAVNEPGIYRVTANGVSGNVVILVEKYFGNASITYSDCSNQEYTDSTETITEISEDGKDWVYTFKDTDSVKITKITAGSQTYSGNYEIKAAGVYRAGWEKADGGDDVWESDKRNFTLMKTVVVTAYIEQKDDYQMYLAHFQHDDESQALCDLSRTAYWDSVPCGTELSERVGISRNNDGYWIRKFRVAEGKEWRIQPTLGGWGSEAYKTGSYSEHYSVTGKAAEGSSLKCKASDYDFESKTDGTDLKCTRSPLLTYHTDLETGVQNLRLVWHGSDKITWGKKGETGTEYSAVRDTINGTENGWYYDFMDLESGKTYFYTLASSDGNSGSITKYFNAAADSSVADFKFAVCGDSQSPEYQNGTNGTYVTDNMNLMMSKSPAFVVSIGDLNNDGNYPGYQWETMFFTGIVSRLFDGSTGYQVPFNAAPGNHDRINDLFRDYLGMDQRYNSFDYGNVMFLTIDVEKEFSPGSAQYEWIEKTLKNDSHAWKLIALHEGPYCYAPRHYSNYRVRKYLCPLFEKYGVKVVFSGHIHCYNHPKAKNGVEYINLPCMASSPATVSNEAPCLGENDFEGAGSEGGVYKANEQGFGMVHVTEDALYIDVMNSKGTALDSQIVISAE